MRDRSHTATGLRKDDAQQQLGALGEARELFHLIGIVGDEGAHAEMQRVSDLALVLMGCVWMQRSGATPSVGGELHLTGRRKIEKAARFDHGAHRRRVRQRLQRVVQINARQRPRELAELRADALAVDDE